MNGPGVDPSVANDGVLPEGEGDKKEGSIDDEDEDELDSLGPAQWKLTTDKFKLFSLARWQAIGYGRSGPSWGTIRPPPRNARQWIALNEKRIYVMKYPNERFLETVIDISKVSVRQHGKPDELEPVYSHAAAALIHNCRILPPAEVQEIAAKFAVQLDGTDKDAKGGERGDAANEEGAEQPAQAADGAPEADTNAPPGADAAADDGAVTVTLHFDTKADAKVWFAALGLSITGAGAMIPPNLVDALAQNTVGHAARLGGGAAGVPPPPAAAEGGGGANGAHFGLHTQAIAAMRAAGAHHCATTDNGETLVVSFRNSRSAGLVSRRVAAGEYEGVGIPASVEQRGLPRAPRVLSRKEARDYLRRQQEEVDAADGVEATGVRLLSHIPVDMDPYAIRPEMVERAMRAAGPPPPLRRVDQVTGLPADSDSDTEWLHEQRTAKALGIGGPRPGGPWFGGTDSADPFDDSAMHVGGLGGLGGRMRTVDARGGGGRFRMNAATMGPMGTGDSGGAVEESGVGAGQTKEGTWFGFRLPWQKRPVIDTRSMVGAPKPGDIRVIEVPSMNGFAPAGLVDVAAVRREAMREATAKRNATVANARRNALRPQGMNDPIFVMREIAPNLDLRRWEGPPGPTSGNLPPTLGRSVNTPNGRVYGADPPTMY